ncbi:MAG: L-fucose/L-arabinose isomerase family protein [Edaphobacter sp.]
MVDLNDFAQLRVGLLGLGLEAYWPQFSGLKPRLEEYLREFEQYLQSPERTIVNLGMIDSLNKAVTVGHQCRQEDLDVLLVYVTTYALSSTLLAVIQRAKVPMILLNLQPEPAIALDQINLLTDRTERTGEWLAYCSSCTLPELANVLRRVKIPFFQVTGALHHDPVCREELEKWLNAARTVKILSHSKLGLMGHYYSGMLDITTDLVQVSGRFGTVIEMLEVDTLSGYRREVSNKEVAEKIEVFHREFVFVPGCTEDDRMLSARTSVALDRMIAEHSLDILAYYYKGTGVPENEDTMSSIILGTSLLTAAGIPVAGEYDVKNAIAMKIMETLGGGGSFTEYYGIDYKDDVVLMGHDGPGHPKMAQSRMEVHPLVVYHGKVGRGLSVQMSVRHGPITLLSIVEDRDLGFFLLVAEGESVAGEILKIGNTNSRYRFPLGARSFVEAWNSRGPAHHCAVGTGHLTSTLRAVAELLQIRIVQIC